MTLTSAAQLCEVGMRDGLQYEEATVSTDDKLRLVGMLIEAGIRRIQVVSFVHPGRVPQMADADALVKRLPSRDDVVFSGLALNLRGVERAIASGLQMIDLSIATNETHSRDNANMSVSEGVAEAERMVETASTAGARVQLNLQTVFGFHRPGDTPVDLIVGIARRFDKAGLESFSLSDTTGLANPLLIRDRVRSVREVLPDVPLVLHLHDTRGLGLANAYSGYLEGVRRFDSSFGGLGGCPFIEGAAGNVCTEDLAFLLNEIGGDTGVDPEKVGAASLFAEAILKRELPGRLTSLVRRRTSELPQNRYH
jgi:hydroxymethylglutaryl-CoA lyase